MIILTRIITYSAKSIMYGSSHKHKWHKKIIPKFVILSIKILVNHSILYIQFILGADSLAYLSVEGLTKAVRSDIKTKNSHNVGHCTACLTGQYPGGIPNSLNW